MNAVIKMVVFSTQALGSKQTQNKILKWFLKSNWKRNLPTKQTKSNSPCVIQFIISSNDLSQ